MKNYILILLFFTSFLQAQTLQNPTYGNTTTNTITVKANTVSATGSDKISVQETDGKINYLQSVNIPVTIAPTPTGYAPTSATLKGNLEGISNRLNQIGNTTAGITNRIYFTGDNVTVTAGTFFASNGSGKGTATSGLPTPLVNGDNQKQYFAKDLISIAQPSATIAPPGNYSGQLTVSSSPTPNGTQQRYTIEIYKTNNGGTPIASGITGAPTGNLGVTVVAILDSGLINLVAGSITNISLNGNLASILSLATGERLRYHVSAQKVGTGGGNVTMSVLYGSDYNSYYDVTVTQKASTVINDSGVVGGSVADALNTLNTNKANLSGAIFTGEVNVLTPVNGNNAVTKTYADGLLVGLWNDRGNYTIIGNAYPSTGGSGSSGAIIKGNAWQITGLGAGVQGTIGTKTVNDGDVIRALINSPGNTDTNWAIAENNLGFTPENVSNKSSSYTVSSATTYTNTKALVDGLATKASLSGATFTGQVKLPNGTIANPSILFPDEDASDSGINHANNGEIQFITNGSNLTQISGAGLITSSVLINSSPLKVLRSGTLISLVGDETAIFQRSAGSNNSAVSIVSMGESTIRFTSPLAVESAAIKYNNVTNEMSFIINSINIGGFNSTGVLKLNNLSGSGDAPVLADASGNLKRSTDALPTSGTYTPTVSNTLNVSSTAISHIHYTRIGNVVTVYGFLNTTVTAASAGSQITLSLPIAKTDPSVYEAGSGSGYLSAGIQTRYGVGVSTIVSNNTEIRLYFIPLTLGVNAISFSFSYTL